MSSPTRLHIPHVITEFDEAMLVPLDRNFSEIQRHFVILQQRIETAEAHIAQLSLCTNYSTV